MKTRKIYQFHRLLISGILILVFLSQYSFAGWLGKEFDKYAFQYDSNIHATLDFLSNRVSRGHDLDTDLVRFGYRNIERGLKVLNYLLSHPYPEDVIHEKKDQHLKDIVAVGWALYHLSLLKRVPLEVCSFVIEDKNFNLFNFLKSSPLTYRRFSTHLSHIKKRTLNFHYGIDVLGVQTDDQTDWIPFIPHAIPFSKYLDSKYKQVNNLLPMRAGHILFGKMPAGKASQLKTNHVFVKLEDNGLSTWTGLYRHTKDLIAYKFPKMFHSDEPGGKIVERNETVDAHMVQLFQEAVEIYKRQPHYKKKLVSKRSVRHFGVRFMLPALTSMVENTRKYSQEDANQILRVRKAFVEYLDKSCDDHIESRTGNEIIFTESELKDLLNYE